MGCVTQNSMRDRSKKRRICSTAERHDHPTQAAEVRLESIECLGNGLGISG